jgi:hypothetical protein
VRYFIVVKTCSFRRIAGVPLWHKRRNAGTDKNAGFGPWFDGSADLGGANPSVRTGLLSCTEVLTFALASGA